MAASAPARHVDTGRGAEAPPARRRRRDIQEAAPAACHVASARAAVQLQARSSDVPSVAAARCERDERGMLRDAGGCRGSVDRRASAAWPRALAARQKNREERRGTEENQVRMGMYPRGWCPTLSSFDATTSPHGRGRSRTPTDDNDDLDGSDGQPRPDATAGAPPNAERPDQRHGQSSPDHVRSGTPRSRRCQPPPSPSISPPPSPPSILARGDEPASGWPMESNRRVPRRERDGTRENEEDEGNRAEREEPGAVDFQPR